MQVVQEKAPEVVMQEMFKLYDQLGTDDVDADISLDQLIDICMIQVNGFYEFSCMRGAISEDKKPGYQRKGTVLTARTTEEGWSCIVDGCENDKHHFMNRCDTYKAYSLEDRAAFVSDKQLCVLCYRSHHTVETCPMKEKWEGCDVILEESIVGNGTIDIYMEPRSLDWLWL